MNNKNKEKVIGYESELEGSSDFAERLHPYVREKFLELLT
jgi:hypothetical protein